MLVLSYTLTASALMIWSLVSVSVPTYCSRLSLTWILTTPLGEELTDVLLLAMIGLFDWSIVFISSLSPESELLVLLRLRLCLLISVLWKLTVLPKVASN